MLVQAGTLPAQDGHPMSPGDEFELQGEATTNPEREQGTEGGQKRDHADDGMTALPNTLCFLRFLEFCAKGFNMSQSTPATEGIPAPGLIGRVAIGDIVRRAARRHPERIALVEGDTRVTFAALDADINRFTHFLLGAGLAKGDRVASLCNNSYQFVITMFAIHKAGMIWVPINTGLAPDDIRYILEHSEARLAIVENALRQSDAAAADR